MRIGIIIGRIGDVDGVALETEKWISVLQRMGHDIHLLSGRFREDIIAPEKQTCFPMLSFFSPECEWEQHRAFFFPPDDPTLLLETIEQNADRVATQIGQWVFKNKIEVLLSQNASALPCHLSMGLGIKRAIKQLGIAAVTHDHDFAWERGDRYFSPFKEITQLVEETFPLQMQDIRHAVINLNAQKELEKRFGIHATVVPNVMDFDAPFGHKDIYNQDFRTQIGVAPDDLLLFQITRIVRRKGIEVAIDLVRRLQNPRVKLVITGSAADDHRKGYYKELTGSIQTAGLKSQVIFAHHQVLSHREQGPHGQKIYSLSDAYAHATACTYFSTYEGFGNAFIECVHAKRPIFVNNYQPVFWPDIGSKGFSAVMLENNQLNDDAVDQIDNILRDGDLQKEIADHNYALGKQYFSFDVLQEKLERLFSF